MASFGGSYKISAGATSGTVLSSAQYAICTYIQTTSGTQIGVVTVHYGPGQTIASTVPGGTVSYSFSTGAIFVNA